MGGTVSISYFCLASEAYHHTPFLGDSFTFAAATHFFPSFFSCSLQMLE